MADGSISGNSGKAVEESEAMTWYFSQSPTYFPSPLPDFPPSPPLEFPSSPPPPSSDSRPVPFDGSQPPMENPHQFTTNSLPLLPPPLQNQQQVISPVPQHQYNVFKQSLLDLIVSAISAAFSSILPYRIVNTLVPPAVSMIWLYDRINYAADKDTAVLEADMAALSAVLLQLLEYQTDPLNFSRRRRMMMDNSRGEQSIPPREGLNIVVRQRHRGNWLVEIRLPRHQLCTFDTAEEAALAYDRDVFKFTGENARLNFPDLFLDQNRAAESTAPPRTEFPPPPPAQQHNPEEDPGSGRSKAAAAADNEVEGLGWGSGTGEGERRKILERENKKTRGVRITIPLEDIYKHSEMRLEDAANNLNVSRSKLKRVCRENGIPRWPPRSKIIKRIPQLNSNDLQHGPSNQASSSSSSIVVHTNQPQLSSAKKQLDTDADREMHLSSFKQLNDGNILTVKARYVNGHKIRFRMPWPSSGLVELKQQVAKRLDLDVGTFHIKYKDEEDELTLIACDEDFQDYVCDARLEGTSSIAVFIEPKHAAN